MECPKWLKPIEQFAWKVGLLGKQAEIGESLSIEICLPKPTFNKRPFNLIKLGLANWPSTKSESFVVKPETVKTLWERVLQPSEVQALSSLEQSSESQRGF